MMVDAAIADEAPSGGGRVVLIVEHPFSRQAVAAHLANAGHFVTLLRSSENLLEELEHYPADLLVIDAAESEEDAIRLCRAVRERWQTPVVVVGGSGDTRDVIRSFDAGAEDYVAGSPDPRQLEKRVEALLRRVGRHEVSRDVLSGPGGLVMRVSAHEVRVGDALVQMTPKEFAVLRLLLERRGQVVTTENLSNAVWGYGTFGQRNFVEAHISRLRQKLRAAGVDAIATIRGIGYKIS